MAKRYFIGPQIVDKETFYQRASAAGLFPKLNDAKYIYRRVWEFGTTPDGVHFQRAFTYGIDQPGEFFMAVRV